MLRRITLNIHIYGGLLCFSYLLILGISVLNFNHPFAFTQAQAETLTWTQPIEIPALVRADAKIAAGAMQRQNNAAVIRAIGSFAEPYPNSNGSWTGADVYHVHLMRPGKEYQIDVHSDRKTATITQTRTGWWALIRDLHGSYFAYADSFLAGTWSWYTDLCAFVVLFAGISGIYLWTGRRRERGIGLVVIGLASAVSILVMLLVRFAG